MSEKISAALAGGFGGMFSGLVIIASTLTYQPHNVRGGSWILFFCLGLIVWGFLGALVALVFKEVDLRKAFFLGIGLPSLLQARNVATDSQSRFEVEPPKSHGSVLSLFVSEAYASLQDDQVGTPACNDGQGRSLKLYGTSNVQEDRIVFYSADRKVQQSIALSRFPETGDARVVQVPEFATGFLISSRQLDSNRQLLPKGPCAHVSARVVIENNRWSGFWVALGFTSTPAYDLKVTLVDDVRQK